MWVLGKANFLFNLYGTNGKGSIKSHYFFLGRTSLLKVLLNKLRFRLSSNKAGYPHRKQDLYKVLNLKFKTC